MSRGRLSEEQKRVARLLMGMMVPTDDHTECDDARWDGVCQTSRVLWGDTTTRHLLLLAARTLSRSLNRITYPHQRMNDSEFRAARTLWRTMTKYGRHDEHVLRLLTKTSRQMSPGRVYYVTLVAERYDDTCRARAQRLETPEAKVARLTDRVQAIQRRQRKEDET